MSREFARQLREGYPIAAMLLALLLLPVSVRAQGESQSDNENAKRTLGAVRTLNTAEVTYASVYKKGYSATLKALGEPPAGTGLSESAAGLVVKDLAAGTWNGYSYHYTPGKPGKMGRIQTYVLTARSLKKQKGLVSYFTDQSGVIRWTRGKRAPTTKDPTIDSLDLDNEK